MRIETIYRNIIQTQHGAVKEIRGRKRLKSEKKTTVNEIVKYQTDADHHI